jgi:hypothetical protein
MIVASVLIKSRCGQCGYLFTDRACGPTHAVIATELQTARADQIRTVCDNALRLDAPIRGWTDREDLAQAILDILDGDTDG